MRVLYSLAVVVVLSACTLASADIESEHAGIGHIGPHDVTGFADASGTYEGLEGPLLRLRLGWCGLEMMFANGSTVRGPYRATGINGWFFEGVLQVDARDVVDEGSWRSIGQWFAGQEFRPARTGLDVWSFEWRRRIPWEGTAALELVDEAAGTVSVRLDPHRRTSEPHLAPSIDPGAQLDLTLEGDRTVEVVVRTLAADRAVLAIAGEAVDFRALADTVAPIRVRQRMPPVGEIELAAIDAPGLYLERSRLRKVDEVTLDAATCTTSPRRATSGAPDGRLVVAPDGWSVDNPRLQGVWRPDDPGARFRELRFGPCHLSIDESSGAWSKGNYLAHASGSTGILDQEVSERADPSGASGTVFDPDWGYTLPYRLNAAAPTELSAVPRDRLEIQGTTFHRVASIAVTDADRWCLR